MQPYKDLTAYFGDLHNHCGISYGLGPIEQAYANAREQLDFCSVTGHAFWPDMPQPNPRTQHIIDFHVNRIATNLRPDRRPDGTEVLDQRRTDGFDFAGHRHTAYRT